MSPSFVTRLSILSSGLSRTLLLILILAVPLVAQRPDGNSSNDPRDPENQGSTNKTDMRTREWLMGTSRKPVRKPGSGPEVSALPQIKEDFERIQFINREMMKSVFAANLVDYQQILKTSAEIKKRATRLKANLAYPEPVVREGTRKTMPVPDEEDIKLLLAHLDKSLISFVTNPLFQLQQEVVDSRLAVKATGNLMEVIDFSDKVRKQAERLAREARR